MNVFMLARIAEAGPKDPASRRAGRVGAALPAGFDDWFATITALVPGERYPTATVAIEVLADTIGMELEPIPAPRSRTFHFLSETTTPRGERVESPASPMSGRGNRSLSEPSSTPDVELQPRSGHTPPGSARRSAPLWKQPTVMTSALLGIAAAITLAIGFAPSRPPDVRPPDVRPPDVRPPPPEAAPAVAASSEPTGVPSATDPTPSAEPTSSSASEPPPVPSMSAVAPSEAPAPSTTSVHKATVAPTRRAPIAPTPVAPTTSKRPKYTRE